MNQSEVARIREQIALEYQSAQFVFHGFWVVSLLTGDKFMERAQLSKAL